MDAGFESNHEPQFRDLLTYLSRIPAIAPTRRRPAALARRHSKTAAGGSSSPSGLITGWPGARFKSWPTCSIICLLRNGSPRCSCPFATTVPEWWPRVPVRSHGAQGTRVRTRWLAEVALGSTAQPGRGSERVADQSALTITRRIPSPSWLSSA